MAINFTLFKLFETNEDLKDMFKKFGKLKYSAELRGSRDLQNHAKMVMCTIDEAITNLDDLDYVIDVLRKVGRSHTRFEGYKPEIFWVTYFELSSLLPLSEVHRPLVLSIIFRVYE